MWDHAVEAVRNRGAHRTSRLVVGAEHEVVDDKLGATVEQLIERLLPVRGLKYVGLFDRHPRQLPTLPGERVAHPGQLLLSGQQRGARGLPLFASGDLMLGHGGLLSRPGCATI